MDIPQLPSSWAWQLRGAWSTPLLREPPGVVRGGRSLTRAFHPPLSQLPATSLCFLWAPPEKMTCTHCLMVCFWDNPLKINKSGQGKTQGESHIGIMTHEEGRQQASGISDPTAFQAERRASEEPTSSWSSLKSQVHQRRPVWTDPDPGRVAGNEICSVMGGQWKENESHICNFELSHSSH